MQQQTCIELQQQQSYCDPPERPLQFMAAARQQAARETAAARRAAASQHKRSTQQHVPSAYQGALSTQFVIHLTLAVHA